MLADLQQMVQESTVAIKPRELKSRGQRYAIACLIPVKTYVYQRWKNEDGSQGDLYWSKWININDLPQEQRQRFWAWYGDDFEANSEIIPASELSIPIGAYSDL